VIELVAITALFGMLFFLQERRLAEWQRQSASERADLIQRIQAPEQAIVTHAVQSDDLTFAVPFDDDDEAAEALKARNA
jgi:hypothetical protein